jgi:hypothetical protein
LRTVSRVPASGDALFVRADLSKKAVMIFDTFGRRFDLFTQSPGVSCEVRKAGAHSLMVGSPALGVVTTCSEDITRILADLVKASFVKLAMLITSTSSYASIDITNLPKGTRSIRLTVIIRQWVTSEVRISEEVVGTLTMRSMLEGSTESVRSTRIGKVAGVTTLSIDTGIIIRAVVVVSAPNYTLILLTNVSNQAIWILDTLSRLVKGLFREGSFVQNDTLVTLMADVRLHTPSVCFICESLKSWKTLTPRLMIKTNAVSSRRTAGSKADVNTISDCFFSQNTCFITRTLFVRVTQMLRRCLTPMMCISNESRETLTGRRMTPSNTVSIDSTSDSDTDG